MDSDRSIERGAVCKCPQGRGRPSPQSSSCFSFPSWFSPVAIKATRTSPYPRRTARYGQCRRQAWRSYAGPERHSFLVELQCARLHGERTGLGTLATSGSMSVMLQGAAAQSYTLTCSGDGLPAQNTAKLAVSQEQGACADQQRSSRPLQQAHGSNAAQTDRFSFINQRHCRRIRSQYYWRL